MTLRFCDSFDHFVTADIGEKWTVAGANSSISAGNGRRSTACLRVANGSSGPTLTLDSQATWTVGLAMKLASLPASARVLIAFTDTATAQCDLRLNADGTVSVTRNGTSLGTSSSALSTGSYFYLEFKVTISDAAGAAEVRVNGSNTGWLNLTSVDTKNTANASANGIGILSGASSWASVDVDDLYICDATGSANTGFLGDSRVDSFLPNGNGNSSQMTGSDADSTDNYLLVDDTAPDDDSTYVQSSTASQKDTYAFADMTHTPSSIFGVQVNMTAKKDDAGSRSIASVTRSGGSDTNGTTQALSTAYVNYRQIVEQDPNTAAAWTKTAFNAAEFGHIVAA